MAAERSKLGPKKRCWTLWFSGLQLLLAVVAAGEAPDDVAKAAVEVSGGADKGGAERGIGGEKIAPLLSLLTPDPFPPVVAEGDDWLLEHHFHSGCFLK